MYVFLTIPAFTSLTGPIAILGQDAKKSIEIGVQQINEAGGIGGRKLMIDVTDTQGKPDVARREMERLVRLQNAPMLFGCLLHRPRVECVVAAAIGWRRRTGDRRFCDGEDVFQHVTTARFRTTMPR